MCVGTAPISYWEREWNTRNIVCPFPCLVLCIRRGTRHARISEKVPGLKIRILLQPVRVDTLCDLVFFNLDLMLSPRQSGTGIGQDSRNDTGIGNFD
ncbi:MAG: hypothetical protein CM1200mP18_00690 [Gammaproteobacteria bacterium]|nr:MAG: hypothetical protein CM1200mP18_00690 [Gammaproteobacteria bacterium]